MLNLHLSKIMVYLGKKNLYLGRPPLTLWKRSMNCVSVCWHRHRNEFSFLKWKTYVFENSRFAKETLSLKMVNTLFMLFAARKLRTGNLPPRKDGNMRSAIRITLRLPHPESLRKIPIHSTTPGALRTLELHFKTFRIAVVFSFLLVAGLAFT